MQISPDHWIIGAKRMALPGGSPMNVRRAAIVHFTAGWSGASAVDWWRDPKAKGASAHVVIDRDGSLIQCRPFSRTAGHAGIKSRWTDPTTGIVYVNSGVNACTIGIEMANAGELERSTYPTPGMGPLAGLPIPFIETRHKNGGPVAKWETYTPAALCTLRDLLEAVCLRYKLDDIRGHDDVCPGRKTDPGPAFPMAQIREHFGFTFP